MQGRVQSNKVKATEFRVTPQTYILTTYMGALGGIQEKNGSDYYDYSVGTVSTSSSSKIVITKKSSSGATLITAEIPNVYASLGSVKDIFNRRIICKYQKTDKKYYFMEYDEDLNLIKEVESLDAINLTNSCRNCMKQLILKSDNIIYVYDEDYNLIKQGTISKFKIISNVYSISKDKVLIYGLYSSSKYAYAFVDLKTMNYIGISEDKFDFKSFLPYMDINIKFIE